MNKSFDQISKGLLIFIGFLSSLTWLSESTDAWMAFPAVEDTTYTSLRFTYRAVYLTSFILRY